MSQIVLSNVNKYFEHNHVLKDINLTIEDGEFMTLLGPSGCGKTTTLRIISGLENPEVGTIAIGGQQVVNAEERHYAPSSKRGLNLVFQSYALWPHMTVFENVAFGLKVKKEKKSEIKELVEDALKKLQIGHLSERLPSELSGGQQQRVAIARAIVTKPKILLLDEPLSNLDAKLRLDMRAELKRLHNDLKTTIIYVTHDQVEALTMSTRIAVFFGGNLAQVDTPRNIYRHPADLNVANFIGNPKINFIDASCKYENGVLKTESVLGAIDIPSSSAFDGEAVLAVYPEDIQISEEPADNGIGCSVYSVLPAGSETLIQVSVKGDMQLLAKVIGELDLPVGKMVSINCPVEKINVYDKKTGKLVSNVNNE